MAKERTVGLWLDETGSDEPRWIVSEDIREGGETTSSVTLAQFHQDDYPAARVNALSAGRRNGLAVMETPRREGPGRCIWRPGI